MAHSPAVVPVLVGPLQVLIALLPAIGVSLLAALMSLFKPRVMWSFVRMLWRLKIQIALVAVVVVGGWWMMGRYQPAGAVAQQQDAEAGTDWPLLRGNPARTGRVPGASDPCSGGVNWAFFDEDAAFFASPAVVGDRIYSSTARLSTMGRGSGRIVCLDADSGDLLWAAAPNDYGATFSSPVIAGDYLVCGEGLHKTKDARIICMSLEPGRQGHVLWTFRTSSHVECAPVIRDGRVYIGAGDDGYYCIALEPNADGSANVLWHLPGEDYPDAETSLAVHDGRVYAGLGLGGMALCVLDAVTGEEIRRIDTGLPVFSPPSIVGDRLYVGMGTGNYVYTAEQLGEEPAGAVWCVDLDTLEVLWKCPTDRTILGAVPVDAGRCYAASRGGLLYEIDAATGRVLATFDAKASLVAAPACGEGHVYVISAAGVLYGLRRDGLNPIWRCQVGSEPLFISSPALARGHIYVGTQSDGLVCAGVPARPRAPVWPGGPGAADEAPLPEVGEYLWQYPADQMGEDDTRTVAAAPALVGDVAVVGQADGDFTGLVCLPGQADLTPEPLWTYATLHGVHLPPAAIGRVDGALHRVWCVDGADGDSGRRLHCLGADGQPEWTRPVAPTAPGHLLLTRHGLYVADGPQQLTALAHDGTERWTAAVGEVAAAPRVAQGIVVVATSGPSALMALDHRTGARLWQTALPSPAAFAPLIDDDTIVVGTDTTCSRRSMVDGRALNTLPFGLVSPPVLDGPRCWMATTDGQVRVLSRALWRELGAAPLPLEGGGLVRCRKGVLAVGADGIRRLNAAIDGTITSESWADTGWLGAPLGAPSVAEGRVWQPFAGWGVVCLGSAR